MSRLVEGVAAIAPPVNRPAPVSLPPQRGPAEHAVACAAQKRALAPLRVDTKLQVQAVPIEHAEAVADPPVPAVLRLAISAIETRTGGMEARERERALAALGE